MKYKLGIFILLISLSISFGINVEASSSKVKVTEDHDAIEFSFEYEENTYKIYRDGEFIWEGNNSQFKDTNLTPGQLYGYKIGIYNKEKLVDVISVKTSTKSNTMRSDADDKVGEEHVLRSSVNTDSIILSWANLKDDDGIYEIYKNQNLIAETKENEFIDNDVEAGILYTYEIVAKTEVSDEQKELINQSIKEQGLDLNYKERLELYQKEHSLIRILEVDQEISELSLDSVNIPDSFAKSSKSGAAYLFRYTTFINDKSISDPLSLGNYLAGDNRGFIFNHSKYRTRTDITADFSSNKIIDVRKIGTTYRYNNKQLTGKPIKTATASNKGIKVTKDKNTSSKKMWRINHDVGVPFSAVYPNITYYVEADVNKNGSFKVRGSHDRMPSHEFYVAIPNSDVIATIFNFNAQGKWFLVPGSPQKYFEISM